MNLKELARKAVSTLFLSMLCLVAFAQTATGLVKDKTGEPMIGVNVLVKGTTNGTITDFDGKFSIPDVPSNATLVVSYIGYLTKEVKSGKDLIIVLEEDNKTLDEVVVIGYGTVKRRDLTGSVASVTGEKLAANPVANVAQALQGQLPGVSVTSQDGRPGAGMSIRIRGGGSITQSNDPLFIVDGVQVSGIDDIPADNIESIDVLKDAASTAIYGARGANGVILVTTKGGKDGRVSVKYNMYYQMKENPKLLETMDPYDYVYNTWAYMKSLGDSYGDGVARYFGLGSKYGNHLNEYKNMTTHNYINDLMQTASSWNHDVSLSGGTDKTKFYSSVNYMDDEGIRVKSGFQRWNANFKLTQKINKKLTADFDLRYSEIEINGSGFGNATSAYTYRPVDNPLGDASFTAGFGQGDTNMEETSNPLYYLNTVDYIKNMYRIRAKGALTWNVIKGLTAKTELSLNRNWNQEKTWNAGQTEKDNSSAKLKKSDGYGVRWATTLNYEVQGLGDNHNLSFLVGNEVLASKSDYTEIYGVGYPEGFTMDDAFGMINMTTPSLGQDYFKGEIGTPNHTLSWFGRANYSYKGKYLLTATFRADGSSKFAPSHQWGYFPAAAAAWRISDEAFMENTRDWLDNLKLRVSYGTSGSDNIDASLWRETWKTEQITVDGEKVTTYVPGDMKGNPDLKWQQTAQSNFALEAGFLKGRITARLEYFFKTTKNALTDISLAPSVGFGTISENLGTIENRGLEWMVSFIPYRDNERAAYWVVNMNGSHNTDKLVKISQALRHVNELNDSNLKDVPLPRYEEGESMNRIWAVRSLGIDPANGQEVFVKRTTGQVTGVWSASDQVPCGNTEPFMEGNINSSFSYKGWGLNLSFNYKFGGQTYNLTLIQKVENADLLNNADRRVMKSRWQQPGDKASFKALTNAINGTETKASSRFVMDENVLRFSSLTLTYRMDETNAAFIKKSIFSSITMNLGMEDLFYWSTVKQERGLDYPFARQFSFSLKVAF